MGFFFFDPRVFYIWEMICKWWLVHIYVSLLKSIMGIGWFGSQANYIHLHQTISGHAIYIYIICIEIHKHGWYVDGQAGMLRTKMHDFFAMNRRLPDGTLPQSQRFWNPRLTTLDLR
jgi:hypothetical protein